MVALFIDLSTILLYKVKVVNVERFEFLVNEIIKADAIERR